MFEIKPWLAMLVLWIGNCGFWLFCFNRVNAFGFPRRAAKMLEKVCIALCFLIPFAVLWFNAAVVLAWFQSGSWLPSSPSFLLSFWISWSLVSWIVLGPLWLESRRWLLPPPNLKHEESTCYRVHQLVPGGSAQNFSTRCLARVPLNEWADLSVTRKQLILPRSIPRASGLRVGHISDLHFTGQYRREHYDFVVARMMELDAQLIVIAGDIIDYARCLPLVQPVLEKLRAPLGVYYVLGNHDRRLKDIRPLINALSDMSFRDLGVQSYNIEHNGLTIRLTGNEQPWFQRHERLLLDNCVTELESDALHICVAHTPDRIHWARSLNVDLLLAGHTHGGQARIPFIGPLVAPSLYGSKFASGVFYLPPTLMHVSRGVAGTHPLRWRCPPEISLLTLISPDT